MRGQVQRAGLFHLLQAGGWTFVELSPMVGNRGARYLVEPRLLRAAVLRYVKRVGGLDEDLRCNILCIFAVAYFEIDELINLLHVLLVNFLHNLLMGLYE